MNQLAEIRSGALDRPFDPTQTKAKLAQASAVLDSAASFGDALKDWPLIEEATDVKIGEQEAFVKWWGDNVHNGGDRSRNADLRFCSKDDAEAKTGITQQQVSRWRKHFASDAKRQRYREKLIIAAYTKAGLVPADNHRAEGTGENEWFTPEKYIEAARLVMGSIDLDPASNPIAQQTVKATQFFTKADDGLTKDWHGTVWLNPPYAKEDIGPFLEKITEEVRLKKVEQAIVLTHNYTDTAWFHMAEKSASLICFTRGRVKFVNPEGEECAPTQGQAFFYYGDATEEFRHIFGAFGFIR